MNATLTPCSAKQAAFLARIVASRAVPPSLRHAANSASAGALSAHECSVAIEQGLKCPYSSDSEPAAEGYYLVKGEVFAVVMGKESNKLYAKKLLVAGKKGTWAYAPGMVYKLAPEQKMTLAQAQEMGHMLGCCVVCGRTLTDPKSVALGLGPICAKKL